MLLRINGPEEAKYVGKRHQVPFIHRREEAQTSPPGLTPCWDTCSFSQKPLLKLGFGVGRGQSPAISWKWSSGARRTPFFRQSCGVMMPQVSKPFIQGQ